jgi:uncharacterized RDD family membrane protein YckC/type II secretory pathway pseudopilin PulG
MTRFWIGRDGARSGPFERDQVLADYESGAVRADDLLWTEGMADWKRADELLGPRRAAPLTLAPIERPATPYAPPASAVSDRPGEDAQAPPAGFWVRFAAAILDNIVLGVAAFALGYVLGLALRGVADPDVVESVSGLAGMLIGWLYFASLESGERGATPGKRALGLQVRSAANGGPIGFGRATGRYFARFVSLILLYIGYLMQPFTARKQALHDMLAGTVVLQRTPASTWLVALAIVIALLVPIGIIAAVGVPSYQSYVLRAKVAQALVEAEPAQAAVARYVVQHQRAPRTLEEAGYRQPRTVGSALRRVTLEPANGILTLELAVPELEGKTLQLVPAITASTELTWQCRPGTVPAAVLPVGCRTRK